MSKLKDLSIPAILVGLMLVGVPLIDTALSVWPPQVRDVSWRFGTAGLFSRAILLPLLGLLLLNAVALQAERRGVLKALALLSAVGSFFLLGVIGLFILDGLQMRAQVVESLKVGFLVNMANAAFKYGIGVLGLGLFAWVGLRAAKELEPSTGDGIVMADFAAHRTQAAPTDE